MVNLTNAEGELDPMEIVRASSGTPDASPSPISYKLPPAMVEKAAARLCWITILCAVTTVLLLGLEAFLQPEFAQAFGAPAMRLTILAVVLLSGAFIVMQRQGWVRSETMLDLGIVFQIVISFAIAMFETAIPWDASDPVLGHSGVGIWLAVTGLLLPNAPLKTGIAAVAGAAMWPLAYWVNLQLNGFEPLPLNRLAIWVLPNFIMAAWAYFLNVRVFSMQMHQVKAEELGSYQLDYLIGKGGMGEVWRAKHKMLARDAAIKLIRTDVLSGVSARQENVIRKRFEREAKATASLRSPHTVALFDFGRTKDNTFYYVMELLDGIDLQTMVDRYGPMHPGRVLNILIQCAESLEEAHRTGLVHRDVKPKNIVLSKLGLQYDFVKILDFGLVKTMMANPDASMMTLEGTATGTPAYLAPEIAMGETKVDGRADLYSLGCVAYFLLSGELVFNEPTPTALALAHVQKTPVPLRQRTELPVPEKLEQIVMQLLEKNPESRLKSAQELQRRLRAIRDEMPRWCEDAAADWWHTNLPETAMTKQSPAMSTDDLMITNQDVGTNSPVGVQRVR
jgi:eukaryotic-like serine/threonine-protein kinase